MNENILDHPQDFRRPLTPQEESKRRELQFDLKEAEKRLKHARIALWIIVSLHVSTAIFFILRDDEFITILLKVVIISLFIGATVYSYTYPLVSFPVVLTLYISLIILAIINQPSTLTQGIFLKIVSIAYLVMGIFYGKERRDILRKLQQYGE